MNTSGSESTFWATRTGKRGKTKLHLRIATVGRHKISFHGSGRLHIVARTPLELRGLVMTWDSDIAGFVINTTLVVLLLMAWAYVPA